MQRCFFTELHWARYSLSEMEAILVMRVYTKGKLFVGNFSLHIVWKTTTSSIHFFFWREDMWMYVRLKQLVWIACLGFETLSIVLVATAWLQAYSILEQKCNEFWIGCLIHKCHMTDLTLTAYFFAHVNPLSSKITPTWWRSCFSWFRALWP